MKRSLKKVAGIGGGYRRNTRKLNKTAKGKGGVTRASGTEPLRKKAQNKK